MMTRVNVNTWLVIASLALAGLAGCAPAGTQPAEPPVELPTVLPTVTPEPALPSGWETYTNQGQCGYSIGHPSEMEVTSQGMYSWLLSYPSTEPGGPVPSFIYISVIPGDFQSAEPGSIYNYDPAEMQILLNMQTGESMSLREGQDIAPAFTYTRLPDTTLGSQPAQVYENTQPWEFPAGTTEIRHILQANGCTYLIGGYLQDQPGAVDEELFEQIIDTFHLAI